MPFDGSGNFTRTDGTRTGATTWTLARDADQDVNAPDHDAHDEDLATGIELAVLRDGQNSPSANLPMGGNKHTGVGDAVANNEYATYGQLLALASPFVAASGVGGTANAITLTPTPAITAHTTGRGFNFIAKMATTGTVTVAISGLAAVAIRRTDGTALRSGDIGIGQYVSMVYNGSQYLSNIGAASDIVALTQTAYDGLTPDSSTLYLITG